jgi:endonuclease/exonuclease/phosphatase family metal-dependent hydrolase
MQVKFVTLNIFKGNLIDEAVDFIKSENPDILALQEVFNGKDPSLTRNLRLYQTLKEELGYQHSVFSPECFYNLHEGKIEHGNAIYSKFLIKEEHAIFYDVPFSESYIDNQENYAFHPRNLQHSVIEAEGARLNVFNTHGIWGLKGRDNKRRLKMSKIIVDSIQNKENVILAGDFNLQPDTQTIKNIEKYLTNVFKNELVTTFNMKRKDNPDYGKVVVDMIFVSRNIKVVEHYCPKVNVSDHLPLVSVLEI